MYLQRVRCGLIMAERLETRLTMTFTLRSQHDPMGDTCGFEDPTSTRDDSYSITRGSRFRFAVSLGLAVNCV